MSIEPKVRGVAPVRTATAIAARAINRSAAVSPTSSGARSGAAQKPSHAALWLLAETTVVVGDDGEPVGEAEHDEVVCAFSAVSIVAGPSLSPRRSKIVNSAATSPTGIGR